MRLITKTRILIKVNLVVEKDVKSMIKVNININKRFIERIKLLSFISPSPSLNL
jgi:hypothetical protein